MSTSAYQSQSLADSLARPGKPYKLVTDDYEKRAAFTRAAPSTCGCPKTNFLSFGRYKALIVDGSGNGYLKTVCDYVHLNPARAAWLLQQRGKSRHAAPASQRLRRI